MTLRVLTFVLVLACGLVGTALLAQSLPTQIVGAQFEAVSIKPNRTGGGGFNTAPDGSMRFTNMPVAALIRGAAPVPVEDVIGLPDWAKTEGYDVVAKTAPGAIRTPERQREMMRNMFIERFKLVAHVEEVERPGFALVVARSDGRLGPQLTKTTLDCAGADEKLCQGDQLRFRAGSMEAHGLRMDIFAGSIRGQAGGPVTNRTGLDGWYDIRLTYSPTRLDPDAPPDDGPQFVTALQEQLGLKLVPEKTKVRILVVDHLERPSPD